MLHCTFSNFANKMYTKIIANIFNITYLNCMSFHFPHFGGCGGEGGIWNARDEGRSYKDNRGEEGISRTTGDQEKWGLFSTLLTLDRWKCFLEVQYSMGAEQDRSFLGRDSGDVGRNFLSSCMICQSLPVYSASCLILHPKKSGSNSLFCILRTVCGLRA